MADEEVDSGANTAQSEQLALGHHGAGSEFVSKVIQYGGGSAIAGGVVGSVEGCFLTPQPGSTTPMLMRALGVIARRTVLLGAVGSTFAAGACVSASVRDKDDYINAAIGGMLAGSIFGFKYRMWSVGLGLATGMALVMGAIKYRHGTYLPPLPQPHRPPGAEPLTPRDNNNSS